MRGQRERGDSLARAEKQNPTTLDCDLVGGIQSQTSRCSLGLRGSSARIAFPIFEKRRDCRILSTNDKLKERKKNLLHLPALRHRGAWREPANRPDKIGDRARFLTSFPHPPNRSHRPQSDACVWMKVCLVSRLIRLEGGESAYRCDVLLRRWRELS